MKTQPKLLSILTAFIVVGLIADLLPHPNLGSGLLLWTVNNFHEWQRGHNTTPTVKLPPQ
ncbi:MULTISPECIES: hypothetical protein [unclassified Coleofasciculus]|uniref:hypothetical protein n=1 Tax=unclassified Coleofasciculus TaxID=2692782 RepID=UPI0018808E30|nr:MULTISPECIES: hypothetical protein [unclassified Coleofasciculus]MBE9129073.1 hypothetical protein [Coleofasciculus sp. LEGE 07081]MBE9152125.1 hypothetical protein [Coleofasciculus sp. LEGE 07092]